MDDIKKRFLTNTDETGRFIVKSLTTGKTYYVEPIGNGGRATHEIYSAKDDVLLYSNKDNV